MSANNVSKSDMWIEAVKRLEMLGCNPNDVFATVYKKQVDFKIVVDHQMRTVKMDSLTEEELEMVKEAERKYDFICYYLIKDEAMWPDGCTFTRYTLLYVGKYVNDYEFDREECIKRCGTVPVYVINMEEPDCSEITEMKYMNVGGNIINIS